MKFSKNNSLKIILIGAGGTGGYIAPHLYRIAYASGRKVQIIIADGDIVEKKNLIRQNFADCDIGKNKAGSCGTLCRCIRNKSKLYTRFYRE